MTKEAMTESQLSIHTRNVVQNEAIFSLKLVFYIHALIPNLHEKPVPIEKLYTTI